MRMDIALNEKLQAALRVKVRRKGSSGQHGNKEQT